MSHCLVVTTAPSIEEARKLADILLQGKLAACINISSPVESHYEWEGKKEKSEERILFIKTQEHLYHQVEETLQSHHSYDTPEVIALPIQAGSQKYLDWVTAQTSQKN